MNYETFFEALTEIITGTCSHVEDLRVFVEEQDGIRTLVAMPHTADHAKLVGKHGATVKAMQLLTQAAALNLGVRIAYNLTESFLGKREERQPFSYNPDFDQLKFQELLRTMLVSVFQPVPEHLIELNGDGIMVTIELPRAESNEVMVGALNAMFIPYCYAQGRAVRIRLGNSTNYKTGEPCATHPRQK